MSKFITTAFTAAALIAVSGAAHAQDDTFNASFKYDTKAPVAQTYTNFEKSAEAACRGEIKRAGFRTTESNTWQQRKCKRELIEQAVKSTRNSKLIAFHNYSVNPSSKTTKLASAK